MPLRLPLAALGAAAACMILPAGAAAATSSNWAGYIAHKTGVRYRTVRGAWTVAAVDCSATPRGLSAAWIGLGGFHTNAAALEQTGTESDCVNGRAQYSAWVELVPEAPATLAMRVRAGDRISARVSVSGQSVTLRLGDLTSGRTFLRTLTAPAIDTTSAEWIVEAPSECGGFGCRVLPLAAFAPTTFTASEAVGRSGHAGVIDDPAWAFTRLELAAGAVPLGAPARGAPAQGSAAAGDLSASGGSFTVTYG